jgi:hypothetical protein
MAARKTSCAATNSKDKLHTFRIVRRPKRNRDYQERSNRYPQSEPAFEDDHRDENADSHQTAKPALFATIMCRLPIGSICGGLLLAFFTKTSTNYTFAEI